MSEKNFLDINKIRSGLIELKSLKIDKIGTCCSLLKTTDYKIKSKTIPSQGGVYAFWWTGDKAYFISTINRHLKLAGPDKRIVDVEITDDWLNLFEENICLYVGKNNSDICSRIGKHLRLKSKRDYSLSHSIFSDPLKTTTGQLKRGLEELFLEDTDIRKVILENVGLSYFILSGDSNSVNRFYLEDKAIGEFYPLLNLDIER